MANILVIDDMIDITDLVQMFLEDKGHSVHCLNNSTDVVAQLKQHNFDLVITDVFMPGENGIKLIDTIRKSESSKVKIIVMSGGNTSIDIDTAITGASFKADFKLKKPFTQEQLVLAVDALLAG